MSAQENPFKLSTTVDGSFCCDRVEELPKVRQMISGHNHLVLISPRRYGKMNLVRKAILQTGRPAVFVNVQMAMSSCSLAELLLESFFTIHPWEGFKDAILSFRAKPTMTLTPETNRLEFSFDAPTMGKAALEDALNLLNNKSDPANRLIVVLNEFQEITRLEPGIDKLLRGIMQRHTNVNYVFLGSEESMMTSIFEDIKSPFFHFGALMHLGRISYDDFLEFLQKRLEKIRGKRAFEDAREILELTKCHPFYTQQLAAVFWDLCVRTNKQPDVQMAADEILANLSTGYFALWSRLNRTNRKILEVLARGVKLQDIRTFPTSTVYSAAARLKKEGMLVRDKEYELEDPFFALWIRRSMQQAAIGLSSAQ